MTREKAIDLLDNLIGMVEDNQESDYDTALKMGKQALSQEPTDEMVHVETLHQVMWERDIAIGQLKELGYDFGQKIEPCTDAERRMGMSFCLRPNVCKKCGKPLTMFEGWTCIECEKAEQEPCTDAVSRQAAIVALDDRMSNLENVDMQIAMGFAKGIIHDLPSVNPQPCDDAISREDAIAEMEELNAVSFYEANEHSKEAYYEIKNMIKTMPSVTQKSGYWIMTNDYLTTAYGSVDYVKCSCCGEDSLEEGNYCPNCGAEMVGEKE